jgi:hypothetical protein
MNTLEVDIHTFKKRKVLAIKESGDELYTGDKKFQEKKKRQEIDLPFLLTSNINN